MKRISLILLCLYLAFNIGGCSFRDRSTSASKALVRRIVPIEGNEESEESGKHRDSKLPGLSDEQTPKVPIEENEVLLQLLNINLDLEKTDEQILVIKDKGDSANPIKIVLVDFDEIRNIYMRTWEEVIQASNQRTFDIQLEDIVGDYNPEIICRGVNSSGETTLDVFRKTTSPTGMGLFFSSICALSSDRPIIIESKKRDKSYHDHEKTGQSFLIIVERKDPDSENDLDIIKETWGWKYQEKRYIKILSEKITGDKLLEQKLKELFSSKAEVDNFKEFLDGSWHKKNIVDNIILFNSEKDEIIFYNGVMLEVYKIGEMRPWEGYIFSLYITSDTISTLHKQINITIKDMDSIDVRIRIVQKKSVRNSDEWQGNYIRLTGDLQESLLQKNQFSVEPSEITLSGIYRSSSGLEIAFEPPYFTWIDENDEATSGGFTLLSNVPLLNGFLLDREIPDQAYTVTFRFLKNDGVSSEDATYLLEYVEKKEENALIKTILLTPANLSINGLLLRSKESHSLEQIVMLE